MSLQNIVINNIVHALPQGPPLRARPHHADTTDQVADGGPIAGAAAGGAAAEVACGEVHVVELGPAAAAAVGPAVVRIGGSRGGATPRVAPLAIASYPMHSGAPPATTGPLQQAQVLQAIRGLAELVCASACNAHLASLDATEARDQPAAFAKDAGIQNAQARTHAARAAADH